MQRGPQDEGGEQGHPWNPEGRQPIAQHRKRAGRRPHGDCSGHVGGDIPCGVRQVPSLSLPSPRRHPISPSSFASHTQWSRQSYSELQVCPFPPVLASANVLNPSRSGGIGQPLSLLLKTNPLITEVATGYSGRLVHYKLTHALSS